MPATLSRLSSISITDTVTAQTLHDLIEQVNINGLTLAELAGGGEPIYAMSVGTATPNPSIAPFWFFDDPSPENDSVLRVFAKPWNTWITVGPDRLELPWKNASATSILPGAYVVALGASQCGLATGATCNVLGFNQSQYPVPVGGIVPAMYFGFGLALWGSHASALRAGLGSPIVPQFGLRMGVSGNGLVASTGFTTAGSGSLYGHWCSSHYSSATIYQTGFTRLHAFVHGPRTYEPF